MLLSHERGLNYVSALISFLFRAHFPDSRFMPQRVKPAAIDSIIRPLWLKKILVSIFIDASFWHHYWHCHCLPGRSFSIQGRQFHICSRCTGIVAGIPFTPLGFFSPPSLLPFWHACLALFVCDGVTQALRIRESNNLLRFSCGVTLPMAILSIITLAFRGFGHGA